MSGNVQASYTGNITEWEWEHKYENTPETEPAYPSPDYPEAPAQDPYIVIPILDDVIMTSSYMNLPADLAAKYPYYATRSTRDPFVVFYWQAHTYIPANAPDLYAYLLGKGWIAPNTNTFGGPVKEIYIPNPNYQAPSVTPPTEADPYTFVPVYTDRFLHVPAGVNPIGYDVLDPYSGYNLQYGYIDHSAYLTPDKSAIRDEFRFTVSEGGIEQTYYYIPKGFPWARRAVLDTPNGRVPTWVYAADLPGGDPVVSPMLAVVNPGFDTSLIPPVPLQNAYAFSYDKLSRLTNTVQYEGAGTTPVNSFVEQGLSYDKNGNFLTLERYAAGSIVDDIGSATYNGNQIATISNNGTACTYTYDANGNCMTDGLNSLKLEYNFLNLTSAARDLSGNLQATYRWLADGTKAGVADNSGTGLEYIGSLIYKRDASGDMALESTSFGGGRIEVSEGNEGNVYTPNYFLTDHLGSTRAIAKPGQTGIDITERNDYYPFGGKHDNPNLVVSDNRFRFSGKEDQTTGNLPYQDFGARFLGKKLPIFTSPDPLAGVRPWESLYIYCGNNPIGRTDPTGMIWDDEKEAEGLKKRTDKQITYLNNDTAKKQAKLDAGGLSDKKAARINDKISDNQSRVEYLEKSKDDIDRLGADQDNIYAFSHISGGEHNVRKGDDGKIYIQTSSDGLSIHEITHVRQSLDAGGLKFSPDGKLYNAGKGMAGQSNMEVEAYKMQYSFDGSFPGNTGGKGLGGIDVHSVGSITNNGKPVYPSIQQYSIDLKKFIKQNQKLYGTP